VPTVYNRVVRTQNELRAVSGVCLWHYVDTADAGQSQTESIELDVGPTTLLNADVVRAKINARPRNKRAPTAGHLRQRQQAAEPDDTGYNRDENNTIESSDTVQLTEVVSCIVVLAVGSYVSVKCQHIEHTVVMFRVGCREGH